MPNCPCCGAPDGEFVMTIIAETSADECRQTDTYWCAQCETEWQVEHAPPAAIYQHSESDFELIGADHW